MKPSNTYRPKWCGHCMNTRSNHGGAYIPLPNNPLRQAWFCQRCLTLLNKEDDK